MSKGALHGKKIGILVESKFIPHELEAYEEHFQRLGASVELISRLWNQDALHIISDIDPNHDLVFQDGKLDLEATRKALTFRLVTKPLAEEGNIEADRVARVDDYAAVLVAANYTSVRLRYFASGGPITPEMTREAPAVRFVATAMQTPDVVVGALCHGLWLLTPVPELLAGRHVTCHEVVLADIHNTGAKYVSPTPEDRAKNFQGWKPDDPLPSTVVTDGDLVTGHSAATVVPYIYAVAHAIEANSSPGNLADSS